MDKTKGHRLMSLNNTDNTCGRKPDAQEVDFVRPYGPKTKVEMKFAKVGRTKQSMKDECDINKIMEKYQKTGAIAHVNKHHANYDFATSEDFAGAMRTVTTAQEMFDALPSSIRQRFSNNPAAFLDFVQDANNKEEGQKLGLWPKEIPEGSKEPETKTKDPTEGDKTDNQEKTE